MNPFFPDHVPRPHQVGRGYRCSVAGRSGPGGPRFVEAVRMADAFWVTAIVGKMLGLKMKSTILK